MILRDKLKDEKYFKEYIDSLTNRIARFEEITQKVVAEKGIKDIGALNGLTTLQGFYINMILAKYSAGESIEDIKRYVTKLMDISLQFEKNPIYSVLLDILSLLEMIPLENEKKNAFLKFISKEYNDDFLINILITKTYNTKNVLFPKPYVALKDVIDLANDNQKEKAIQRLKKYLDKEWYKGHSDAGWYNSHKSKHNIYTGYWSFESGALVKILGLDDTLLKDQKYYPYDMVHWKIS
ncbi:hypothetical protein CGC54_09440 [Capnocytophaga canimorsus]|uniref:DUF1911 domain-containing protein n=1 Tax=Capnocytophaga canimorsus TaxID=28188 RepID=A0AAD0EAW5_9FLAO|nr:PoNi-like cognate immunity protein [Capnocytophaga canimorsus]ATA94539.1 hypothetical protein CGC54_09440 [Capnocytophaga canimorsus]